MDINSLVYHEGHFINKEKLNKDSIIIDAGAGWGEMPNVFNGYLQIWPKKIYAFEPNKTCLEKLKKQRDEKPYPNVLIYPLALVGEGYPTQVEFTEYYDTKGKYAAWGNLENLQDENRFLKKASVDEIRKYSVDTLNFNTIFDIVKEQRIDYLKMDIEGSEKGILETIKREIADKIDQISVEIHDRRMYYYAQILEGLGFNNVLVNIFPNIKEIYAAKGD